MRHGGAKIVEWKTTTDEDLLRSVFVFADQKLRLMS